MYRSTVSQLAASGGLSGALPPRRTTVRLLPALAGTQPGNQAGTQAGTQAGAKGCRAQVTVLLSPSFGARGAVPEGWHTKGSHEARPTVAPEFLGLLSLIPDPAEAQLGTPQVYLHPLGLPSLISRCALAPIGTPLVCLPSFPGAAVSHFPLSQCPGRYALWLACQECGRPLLGC